MKPYKIESEADDHFVVHDGTSSFRVAKLRLAHGTVERIRRYADGGEVTSGNGPMDVAPDEAMQLLNLPPPTQAPTPGPDGMHPAVIPPDLQAQLATNTQQQAVTLPPHGAPTVVPAQAAPSAVGSGSVGVPPGLDAGVKQEQTGLQQRAQAVQAEGSATSGILDSLAQQRTAMAEGFQAQMAEHQAKADAMFNQIQAGTVDPNHFWATRSTGQKVSAAIGLILGGIGAGLTHGPNYALQVLDKSIDRDIESQKLELGKKENLLGHYMQQGRDMIAAHNMAKADLLDVASAQLQKVAATYAGQKAAADATVASGQLRANAALLRQQATERSIQIASGQLGLAQSRMQAEALGQLMRGVSGGGGFNAGVLEMPAFKEYRERAVHLPDGSVAFAADKEDAGKARESFAAVSTLKSKLARYSDLLANGNPATTDRGTADATRADILAEMGHLHGLNRLSDKDLELFEQQVPKLSDLVKPMAAQKLKALGKSIDDRVWSVNQTLLNRPGARRPGG